MSDSNISMFDLIQMKHLSSKYLGWLMDGCLPPPTTPVVTDRGPLSSVPGLPVFQFANQSLIGGGFCYQGQYWIHNTLASYGGEMLSNSVSSPSYGTTLSLLLLFSFFPPNSNYKNIKTRTHFLRQ